MALSIEYPWITKALVDSDYFGEVGTLVRDYPRIDFEVVNSHFSGKGFVRLRNGGLLKELSLGSKTFAG